MKLAPMKLNYELNSQNADFSFRLNAFTCNKVKGVVIKTICTPLEGFKRHTNNQKLKSGTHQNHQKLCFFAREMLPGLL